MLNDDKDLVNIYKIEIEDKLNFKKILFVILTIIAIVCAVITAQYIIKTIKQYEVYKRI